MNTTKLPRHNPNAIPTELAEVSVKHLGDLLDAIMDGVFVIGNSIPDDQRREIARELGVMDVMNGQARQALNLPKVPRSMHLQRGAK